MGILVYFALAIGAVAGGAGGIVIQKFFVQPAAVEKAVRAEAERCIGKIAEIRAQSAEATLAQFEEATQAALGIGPTPVERVELEALCATDVACRERKP